MGKYYNPSQQTKLGVSYNITKSHPFDLRTIVGSFSDLINPNTFGAAAYDRMKVLVADEMNVYMLKATGDNEPGNASWDFDEEDYNNNKKLWKRLTIETITASKALHRAKSNLVNGALIYVANDVYEGEVYEFEKVFDSSVYINTEQELDDISNAKIGYFSGPKKFYHYIFDGTYYTVTDDYLPNKAFSAPDTDPIFIASDGSKYKYTSGYGDLEPYVDAMPSIVKKGLYFCQNINGEGVLTLAGGSEVVNSLESVSESAALSAAMGRKLNGAIKDLQVAVQNGLENITIDFGQYEDSVSVVIMDPSTITRARMRNVKKLLISYGETIQQEYTEGTTINLGNADFIVLDITRTEEGQNATVGLTLKKNN